MLPGMLRGRFQAGLVAVALLLHGAARDEAAWAKGEEAAYAKDLEFLLDELPKKARTLLAAKGVDWAKATKELRAAAKKVKDDVEYVRLVNRIVARLRDGHAGITKMSPRARGVVEEAPGGRGEGPAVDGSARASDDGGHEGPRRRGVRRRRRTGRKGGYGGRHRWTTCPRSRG